MGRRGCLSPTGAPEHPGWARSRGRRWRLGARVGAAAGRSRFLACLAACPAHRGTRVPFRSPTSKAAPSCLATSLLLGHHRTAAATSNQGARDPWASPTRTSRSRGSYPIGGGRWGLHAEQLAVGRPEVAVAVAAEVPAPPHQLVDLQARQPGHGRRGGDDGGYDPPGDPLALRTGEASPAARHGMGTPQSHGLPLSPSASRRGECRSSRRAGWMLL